MHSLAVSANDRDHPGAQQQQPRSRAELRSERLKYRVNVRAVGRTKKEKDAADGHSLDSDGSE